MRNNPPKDRLPQISRNNENWMFGYSITWVRWIDQICRHTFLSFFEWTAHRINFSPPCSPVVSIQIPSKNSNRNPRSRDTFNPRELRDFSFEMKIYIIPGCSNEVLSAELLDTERRSETTPPPSFSATMEPKFKPSPAGCGNIRGWGMQAVATSLDTRNLPTCVPDMAKVSAAMHNQQFSPWTGVARTMPSLRKSCRFRNFFRRAYFSCNATPPNANEEPTRGKT